jgi:hypothetical protein
MVLVWCGYKHMAEPCTTGSRARFRSVGLSTLAAGPTKAGEWPRGDSDSARELTWPRA